MIGLEILERKTIYCDGEYATFPCMARLKDGRVICAFRHAKERQKQYGMHTHIDPTAKGVFIVSQDGGKTFDPELHVIVDDEMSDQDPCFNVLSDGRIIATYFRWDLCPIGEGAQKWGKAPFKQYGRSLWEKYDCFPDGACYSISDDDGKTWKHYPPFRMENVPEGAGIRGDIVELPNGELLLPFYGSLRVGELSRSGLMISKDRGETWEYLSTMAFDPKCKKNFLEPYVYRTKSGRLVGLFRTQTDWKRPLVKFADTYLNLHIAVSDDDGRTFGPVKEIPNLWGSSPFHAMTTKEGKVLLSFGYRRMPFGVRARLCDAELEHIEDGEDIILCDDAPNGDLGYPHALQLDDGTVLVAYYISGDDGIRKIEGVTLKID